MSLVLVLLIVAGLGALSTLPRTEDPHITNRITTVVTQLPGASAERVEVLVTEKIEQKLRKLPEINIITSISRPNISVVQIKLHDEITNTKPVWSRVRDLLSDVTTELPVDTLAPILEDDRGYAYTQIIALNWQAHEKVDLATLARYANELQNQLKKINGTDIVDIYGQANEEVLVEIDHAKSSKLQITSHQVSQLILQADAKVAAGQLINNNNQMLVELTGAFDSVQRIRNIPIKSNTNNTLLTLGDIATIEKSVTWPGSEIALVNDRPATLVATRMLPTVRIDLWTQRVDKAVNEFKQQLPDNIQLEVLFNQNKYTETRLGDLLANITEGFIIITIVLLLTLGWRSATIVAISLPLTVLFTLAVMSIYGLPIHQMSVTGLVVALGIMVDNAIVMTDTIQKQRQKGARRLESVNHAVKHLWVPLLGSTTTTVLAFMPIVLMPGPAGEFVGGIALSVIFSLIGSYFISHTIVAGLAGRFLPKGKVTNTCWYTVGIEMPHLAKKFECLLRTSLTYQKTVLTLVFCLPLTGFILAQNLTEQFFPPSDRDMFQIELFMPSQSSILATKAISLDISEYLYEQPGIEKVRWMVGKNMPSFYYNLLPSKDGVPNYAQAMVTASDLDIANELIPKIQKGLDLRIPEAQILVRKLEQGPPFNAPVELRIFGSNLDTLKQIGDHIRYVMSTTEDVVHTRATLQPGTPKVWVEADESLAAIAGLTLTDIAQQLNSALSGDINGTIIEETEEIPVRIRLSNAESDELSKLANIHLISPKTEQAIPLTAIADLSIKPSRGAIPHRNGVRVNVIEGYISAGVLPSIVLERVSKKLEEQSYTLPDGYRLEIGGESAERDKAVSKLLASVGIILTLLITVVVLSFNSFRLSVIIFLSGTQSIGLGLLSVYLFNYPFGFTVILALLGLMGLAINAAIVIIAELKSNPDAVKGDNESIIKCVQGSTRHITSTTITTVGGFLPLVLAGGGFWPPFAVAVAGGTVLTTMLSFVFVPVTFSIMAKRHPFEQTKK